MARRKTRAGWRRCSHHSRGFDHVPCSPASRRSAGTPSSRARRAAPSTLGARCLKCRYTRTPQKAQARRLRGHQQSPALLTQRAAPQPVLSQAARAALPTRRLASPMLTVTGPPGDVADESQYCSKSFTTHYFRNVAKWTSNRGG